MRILVADDDAVNRRLLEVTLQRWGYDPLVAADGAEAWAILREPDGPPLAVLDWMMPHLDGLEVCRRVRAQPQSRLSYLVLLTTRGSRDDVVAGLEAGADDFIAKPFDREELHARLQVGIRMLELQATLADRARELEAARQQAQHYHALARERQQFDSAVTGMSDGVLLLDRDLRVTFANRAACRLLGLSPASWPGASLRDQERAFAISPTLGEAASAPGPLALEFTRRGTGPALCLDGRLSALRDEAGEVESYVLALRDVTAEREAHRLQSSFFSLVSHKLRTPLSILGGYLALAQTLPREMLAEQWDTVLEVCLAQERRLEGIIERLLDVKRLQSQSRLAASETEPPVTESPVTESPVTESTAIEIAVIDTAVNRAAAKVRDRCPEREFCLRLEIQPGAALAMDPSDLEFVLVQLFENSVKFRSQPPREIRVRAAAEGNTVRIEIADNGPGIPHEYLDQVLQGFVQVEESHTGQVPGLGVGLYLARQTVQAYGGTLVVESPRGEGCTVTMAAPRFHGGDAGARNASAPTG